MITLLQAEDLADYTALSSLEPVIGARLHTQLAVYGTSGGIAGQWIARDSAGTPTAALLRFSGWMVICAGAGVDIPELADFLQAVGGFRYIEGSSALVRALGGFLSGVCDSSCTMCYPGEPPAQTGADVCDDPSLEDVHRLLCTESLAGSAPWTEWYPHTSHLVRHGLGFAAAIYEDGQAVATGGVYASGAGYGVIGGLTTLQAYRSRGYAGRIVRHLCRACIRRGWTPVLFCAGDSLADYYRTLGFVPLGHWAQLDLG